MKKILLFCDPGIDDSLAIMYALLHPNLEVVGIVSSYGNVPQEKATNNAAYLLKLAGREDIPLIGGAKGPLSGEITVYYPEIHGPEGLGPIRPPETIVGELLNYDRVFDIIEKYKGELTIVDVGRNTSLAIAFILGEEHMKKVKEYFIMGGAFLVPGNVTPVAEANFHGDPIAANLVLSKAKNVTIVPLNVTNEAIVTSEVVDYITQVPFNPFTSLIQPIFEFYADAYLELVPGMNGAPMHDVLTLSALTKPEVLQYIERPVTVQILEDTRGQSVTDFRPGWEPEPTDLLHHVALELDYQLFIHDFVDVMTKSLNE
ncbi:nucleoside hydrolase [Alkalihalobacterium chitinilyticum]|uniref:Nucleoside hydrolase n=1 Tax=Alkalihalobacterium chitinilyticum TaxID=2980103 RepID=A0ABT5VJT0_9BACI|nr:nucleoside hydrolase [Alkalihalobacterium chitinilyticum]MDE5415701.1 nucleoside hydrolase [Alkalihalobacterium chitinilyticum]